MKDGCGYRGFTPTAASVYPLFVLTSCEAIGGWALGVAYELGGNVF